MIDIRLDSRAAVFARLVDSVAARLVEVRHGTGHALIDTPLIYTSGSSVVVRIEDGGKDFFVTDFGCGHEEASMMGGSATFSRHAAEIARQAGIRFDSQAFFATRVSEGQLAGAVAVVANCSQRAVEITAFRLAERKRSDAVDVLYKRLVSVFPERRVARDVDILGQSNTHWHVAALVRSNGHEAIFDPVSHHHASVFAATAKFHDIAAMENAPSRVAVVRRKEDFKTYLAVLSQAADVIERDAPDSTYHRLAVAA